MKQHTDNPQWSNVAEQLWVLQSAKKCIRPKVV